MTAQPVTIPEDAHEAVAEVALAFIQSEVGENLPGMSDQAHRFAAALVPTLATLLDQARSDERQRTATLIRDHTNPARLLDRHGPTPTVASVCGHLADLAAQITQPAPEAQPMTRTDTRATDEVTLCAVHRYAWCTTCSPTDDAPQITPGG